MIEIILKGQAAQDYIDYGKAIEVAKIDSKGAVITFDAYEALLDGNRAEEAVAEQEASEEVEEEVVVVTPVAKANGPWIKSETDKLMAAMKDKTPSRKKISWLVGQLPNRTENSIRTKVNNLGGYIKKGSVYID